MPIYPGDKITLSDEDHKLLAGLIGEVVADYQNRHAIMFSDIQKYWEWYEAKPQFSTRNDPWPNASNIIVPFTRIYGDAAHARIFSSMTAAPKFWHGTTQNEDFRQKYLKHIVDFLNWGYDGNEFDAMMPLTDQSQECAVIGSSVVAVNWQQRDKYVMVPNGKKPRIQKVRISRGPVIEHIPREYIMWDPGLPIGEAEVIIRQYITSHSGLRYRVTSDGWDPKAVEEATKAPGVYEGGAEVFMGKMERAGYSTDGHSSLHDVREVHICWPFIKNNRIAIKGEEGPDATGTDIVVTFHPMSGQILRVIPKPYYIAGQPFYDTYFRKRSGQSTGVGSAKMLEHMQRGASTMVNQAIDAITLANSLVGKTTDPSVLNQIFSPNKWLLVDNINETVEMNMSKVIVPDVTLINLMKTFAESLMGISDPALGRETRLGGHPQPATSFLGALQQGAILMNSTLKLTRRCWSQIGIDIATLYQQFEMDEGKLQRALGPVDGQALQEWMFPDDQPIQGNLELDIHALSEVHNPEADRQKAVMVDQMVGNYYARVMQGLQAMADPRVGQNPLISGAIVKMIESHSETLKGFLESADVDEIEKFIYEVKQNGFAPPGQVAAAEGAAANGAQQIPGMAEGGTLGTIPAGPPGTQG